MAEVAFRRTLEFSPGCGPALLGLAITSFYKGTDKCVTLMQLCCLTGLTLMTFVNKALTSICLLHIRQSFSGFMHITAGGHLAVDATAGE